MLGINKSRFDNQRLTLSAEDFTKLCQQARVIKASKRGPCVLYNDAQSIVIKIFYRKGVCSKRRFLRQGLSFRKNALRLAKLGINTVDVQAYYNCPEANCEVIVYPKIKGIDLRAAVQAGDSKVIEQFMGFLAHLHQQGIFFRSVHLGNVLRLENKQMALLDISDVRYGRQPLNLYQRVRNIAHVLENRTDGLLMRELGINRLLDIYFHAAKLSLFRKKLLLWYLFRRVPDLS